MLITTLRTVHFRTICMKNTSAVSTIVQNFSTKNYSSSDDEDNKVKKQEKKDEKHLSDRLNKLLASMPTDDNLTLVRNVKITKVDKKQKDKRKLEKEEKKPKNIVEAAKDAAKSLGGNISQTESELLAKLLKSSAGPTPSDENEVDKDISTENKSQLNLNELIVGMKIDRDQKYNTEASQTKAQYVKRSMNRVGDHAAKEFTTNFQDRRRDGNTIRPRRPDTPKTPAIPLGSVNLFGGKPLGIFQNVDELSSSPDPLTKWNELKERELKLAITHPPANYFQKMILWTEQGKIWKFPIDNEQGLDTERNVYFADHVFLESHLEPWCPKSGPIRHFMELVCVGLSQNPYITVKDKQSHINWFKEYFEGKKEVLKDMIIEQPSATSPKQLEN